MLSVHEHPEEDQEMQLRDDLAIILSDPIRPGENERA